MSIELNALQISFLSVYFFINIIAFIYMGIDKSKAMGDKRRVPEVHFLFLSILFCALGVLLGMIIFRHKIRNLYFFIGVPVALVGNISIIYLLYLL